MGRGKAETFETGVGIQPLNFKKKALNIAVATCFAGLASVAQAAGSVASNDGSDATAGSIGYWDSIQYDGRGTSGNRDAFYFYLETTQDELDDPDDYLDPYEGVDPTFYGNDALDDFTVTVSAQNVIMYVDFDLYGEDDSFDAVITGALANETLPISELQGALVANNEDADHNLKIERLVVDTDPSTGTGSQEESVLVYVGSNNVIGSYPSNNTGLQLSGDDVDNLDDDFLVGLEVVGTGSGTLEFLTIENDGSIRGNTFGSAAGISLDDGSVDAMTINNTNLIVSGNDGIRARSVNDSLDITNTGVIAGLDTTGSQEGYGIRVSNYFGPLDGDPDAKSVGYFVDADDSSSGYVEIDNQAGGFIYGDAASIVLDEVTDYVLISNAGNIGESDESVSGTDGIPEVAIGIFDIGGISTQDDIVTLVNDAGVIRGETAVVISGVYSTSENAESGDVRITNENGGEIIGLAGSAIEIGGDSALPFYSGTTTIDDDLFIDNLGSTSSIRGVSSDTDNGHGIDIDDVGGNFELENEGLIYGTNPLAESGQAPDGLGVDGVTGYVSIENSGTIEGFDDAIDIQNTHDNVTIINSGTLRSVRDDAIQIDGAGTDDGSSADNVSIEITNSGSLVVGSQVTAISTGAKAIEIDGLGHVDSDSGSSTTTASVLINNSGSIGHADDDSGELVIDIDFGGGASTNEVVINNSGDLIGAVSVVYGNDLETNTFTFNNSGTWTVESSDESRALDADSDNFGEDSELSSSVINTGLVNLTDNGTFFNLDIFDNAGGSINLTADDGSASTLTITLNDSDDLGEFRGQRTEMNNDSLMTFDADLTAATQGALETSRDQLIIEDGKAVGVTQVTIDSPEGAGYYLPTGAQLVSVDDADNTVAGAFVLDGGAIERGLWSYDLYNTTSATDDLWFLASSPSEYAHELPSMITNGQESWMEGAVAFRDHTANARLNLEPNDNAYDKPNGGAWIRAYGTKILMENRNDHVQATYGVTNSYQNNYDQRINGVVFGADRASYTDEGGTWLLGFMGGASHSDLTYTTSTTQMDLTSASLGIYASYLGSKGGFFNFLIKGDAGTTDYDMNSAVSGLEHDVRLDTTSYGAMMDFGYRFRASSAFFEPALSVASVTTDIDETNFLNTDVDFGNNTEVRSRLAFTTGVSFTTEDGSTWEPYVTVAGVHNSGDENTVRLTSAGSTTTVQDSKVETYAESAFGIRYVGNEGSYGYLRIDHSTQAGDDNDLGYSNRKKSSVTAGMKITW